MTDPIGGSPQEQHEQHLLIHTQFAGHMRAKAELERRGHLELVPRNRIVVWWESLWFALHNRLARYVNERADSPPELWQPTPRYADLQAIFEETEEEYRERLYELAAKGLKSIPVHTSPYVPEGTAYLFDASMLDKPFVTPGEGLKFRDSGSLWAEKFAPSVASVILDTPDDDEDAPA